MKREIIRTDDGSTTIRLTDWNECYHSTHGAIQESYHVFIKNGLSLFEGRNVSILEVGFGTGLNALVTFIESIKYREIDYVGVEAYPISEQEAAMMNYADELPGQHQHIFDRLHESKWEQPAALATNFQLTKRKIFFDQIDYKDRFDLIYFDAFGFQVQPELWSVSQFRLLYTALKQSGLLVTYSARGVVKRNLIEAGFRVEKLPGPPGKREMIRAFKDNHFCTD